MLRCLRLGVVGVAILCGWASWAAAQTSPSPIDWSAWQALPVFEDGRVMPLDSLARSVVEEICGRTNPTLDLAHEVAPAELKSSSLAEARRLFPELKPRKFTAPELLWSWLVEPEKWEDVPFLAASHDELRTKYLGLPATNAEGEVLKFASPRQLAEAEAFQTRLDELRTAQRDAAAEGREFKLTGLDRKVADLFGAYALFRTLTFDEVLDPAARGRFQDALRGVAEAWAGLGGTLDGLAARDDQGGLGALTKRLESALEGVDRLSQQGSFSLAEGDRIAGELAATSQGLATWFRDNQAKLDRSPPPGWDAEQIEKAREMFRRLGEQTSALATASDALYRALYDNRERIRVVPALNAAALEDGRNPEDESQPWLDLQTLILGSERALSEYPAPQVSAVREAFRRAARAYPGQPGEFSAALEGFAAAVGELGRAVTPLREQLPIRQRDEALLAYTAYPAATATANEVRYNALDPFLWSWVISLLATLTFGAVFILGQGSNATSRRLFWLGLLVLAGGLVWTAYGFYLRISITRWAPVTNMYETVIYVPFFVSLLGAWFALLPLTWEGLKNAWRITAVPGTWEAARSDDGTHPLLSDAGWRRGQWFTLAPRIGLAVLIFCLLAVWSYAAGGRHIINLLPDVDEGSTLPTTNDLLTWGVGLVVLAASVWYVPRAILSLALAPLFVPWTLRATPHHKTWSEVYPRWSFALAATGVAFFGSCVAWYSPVLDKNFSPLTPVLRDNFWLLIHVLTIVSSYGAGALAWGLGNIALAYYLFGRYREPAWAVAAAQGHRPAASAAGTPRFVSKNPPEAAATLAGFVYKAEQVAVLLLAAGTILGALWADVAWGRFWGWDPKEVWALISLLVYVAVLHARYAGWVNNFGLAASTVLGATAVIMSWYGVNFVLGQGLHSYGFGEGQTANWYVAGVMAANWVVLGLAAARYYTQTRPRPLESVAPPRAPGPPTAPEPVEMSV